MKVSAIGSPRCVVSPHHIPAPGPRLTSYLPGVEACVNLGHSVQKRSRDGAEFILKER